MDTNPFIAAGTRAAEDVLTQQDPALPRVWATAVPAMTGFPARGGQTNDG